MPGKKEDKTTFVSEQWGLQLADLENELREETS